jgi:SAM-dependent methyltransferase
MLDLLFADPELAGLYDSLGEAGNRRDFEFYLPLIIAAGSVLDVGCGTGSLLHEARRQGHWGYLCGVDPTAAMIEVARRHRDIEWILGALPSGGIERQFDLILMTGHAFQVLTQDDELRVTLNAIHDRLTATGRLAFETRNPAARDWETWPQKYASNVVDSFGRSVRVACRIETPFDGCTLTFAQSFTSPAWDTPQERRSTLRFIDRETLATFLGEADLAIEAQFGDWDRSALTDTSPEIITLVHRR